MIEFLFLYLACLLSTCTFIYMYENFTKLNFRFNVKNVFCIFTASLVMAIFRFCSFTFGSLILYFIFFPLFLFRKNFITCKKCFLTLLLIWVYSTIFDLIISVILLALLNFVSISDLGDKLNNSILLINTLIVCIVNLFISRIIKVQKFTNKLVDYFSDLSYINVLFCLFFVMMFIIGCTIFLNVDHLKTEFLLIIILILIIITFGLLFSNILVRYESKLFLKNVKENNEFYIDLNNQSRIFKHNIVSKILAIKSVANEKSMKLIDDLINEIEGKINKEVHFKPIPYGLIGIIYQKLSDNHLNIDLKISNEIKDDLFDLLTPRTYNLLIEKLSIMLDNALEACKICDDKVIAIDIYDSKDVIIVKVINTFSSQIDIDQLGNLNYSTKSNRRGLGLFSMLRDKNIDIKIEILNNLFIAKLMIKKSIKSK